METGNNIDISVIVPVYNTERYVWRCLESICSVKTINIEVICIDDGSTDQSLALMEKYAETDKRIHVYENKKNKGLSYSRNVGVSKARGKYILFVDSDDCVETDGIKKLYKIAEENKLDLLFFNFCLKYDDNAFENKDSAKNLTRTGNYSGVCDGVSLFEKFYENGDQVIAATMILYNRAYLTGKDIHFFDGVIHEDFLFYPQVILQAKRTMCVSDAIYYYHRRANSTSTNMSSYQRMYRFKSFVIIYCELYKFLNNHKLMNKNEAINDFLRKAYFSSLETYTRYLEVADSVEIEFDEPDHEFFFVTVCNEMEGRFAHNLLPHIGEIRNAGTRLVYGAGTVANDVVKWLGRHGIHDFHVVISDGEPQKYIYGSRTEYISEYAQKCKDCLVIVSVTKYAVQEILKTLKSYGFKHVLIAAKGAT